MNRSMSRLVTCLGLQHPQRLDFLNINTCFYSRLYGIQIQRENFPLPLAHCAYWQGLSDRSSQPALSLLSSPDLSRHGTSEHAPPMFAPSMLSKEGERPPAKHSVHARAHGFPQKGPFLQKIFLFYTTIHTRSSMAIADGCIQPLTMTVLGTFCLKSV